MGDDLRIDWNSSESILDMLEELDEARWRMVIDFVDGHSAITASEFYGRVVQSLFYLPFLSALRF